MRIVQNNLIVLTGTLVVLITATYRSINPDPQLVWLGSMGILVFALCAVGQIIALNVRVDEIQQDVEALQVRVKGSANS